MEANGQDTVSSEQQMGWLVGGGGAAIFKKSMTDVKFISFPQKI
jgi:hypothetical protein